MVETGRNDLQKAGVGLAYDSMENYIIKSIPVSSIQDGMLLASDISYGSAVLLRVKAILLTSQIELLETREIKTVRILEPISIQNRPEFKEFENAYEASLDGVKSQINNLIKNNEANDKAMLGIVNDISHKVKNGIDLINYVGFMRQKDEVTYSHCMNVSLLCNVLGSYLKLQEEDMTLLTLAGLLHDVGKISIPSDILNKKGSLTHDEFEVMKTHTTIGYEMLKPTDLPYVVKLSALMHHEKGDGSGYPLGVTREKIDKFSSIVTICDIYEAMTAKRPYRDKVCPFTVIEALEAGKYGELHTEYLMRFLECIAQSQIHNYVKLSDGTIGEITFINPHDLVKPILKIGENFINLAKWNDLKIISVL